MENKIEVFNHEVFGNLNTVIKENDIYFEAKEVASCLGYSNTAKAIQNHVDNEDKLLITNKNPILGLSIPDRGMYIINESGLYSLIMKSKLPQAKFFKRWVTSKVLPSIRKHGGYLSGQEEMSPEELMAKAVIVAESQIKKLKGEIEEKIILIDKKSEPISLTKMYNRSSKVAQSANIYLEHLGYQEKRFIDQKADGWTLTEKGRELGTQVNPKQIFWIPEIRDELPSVVELLSFAERLGLRDMKNQD